MPRRLSALAAAAPATALLLMAGPTRAQPGPAGAQPGAAGAQPGGSAPRCKDFGSIGAATMAMDGTITMRVRTLPPGPIGEGQLTYPPAHPDYRRVRDHLGGIAPGETKSVRPFC